MAKFLKIVAAIHLLCVWGLFFLISGSGARVLPGLAFFIAVGLSVPAAVLYAFGQIVDDVKAMRNDMSKIASGIGLSTGQFENVTAVARAQAPVSGETVSGETEQDIEKMYPVETGHIRFRSEKDGKIYSWTRAGGEKVYPDWRSFRDENH